MVFLLLKLRTYRAIVARFCRISLLRARSCWPIREREWGWWNVVGIVLGILIIFGEKLRSKILIDISCFLTRLWWLRNIYWAMAYRLVLGPPLRYGGGMAGIWRWVFSFVACLSHLTIDHASLSSRSTIPTPIKITDTPPRRVEGTVLG